MFGQLGVDVCNGSKFPMSIPCSLHYFARGRPQLALEILKEANEGPVCDEQGLPRHESSANHAIQACQDCHPARPSRRVHDMQPNFPVSQSGPFESRMRKLLTSVEQAISRITCGMRTVFTLRRYDSLDMRAVPARAFSLGC